MLVWLLVSLGGLVGYFVRLKQAIAFLPQFSPSLDLNPTTVTVIVPAYNEADNIEACVTAILHSTDLNPQQFKLWVVDDQSIDRTWQLLQAFSDPRLHLLAGTPRPKDQTWQGKNWACVQAAEATASEFLLFIDADVRLEVGAIETILRTMQQQDVDFLNCIPALVCGSLGEWLIQPLIFMNLLLSLGSKAVRDPNSPTAFAAGPMMAFRRSAYAAIGGHRAVAEYVAEDVALARRIKQAGFNTQYWLGARLARLRMYRSWSALWEGWTKVLYVGADRQVSLMAMMGMVMVILYGVPTAGVLVLLNLGLHPAGSLYNLGLLASTMLALAMHYKLRQLIAQALDSQTNYWWLQGIGGILVAVMALVSVVKAETGWGWTWRGRQLD
jgi:cellulose synthase/poly-beta-1,6-N-acetylglucosamine synthase-like glycosyltransferase